MTDFALQAPPMSWANIASMTDYLRRQLGLPDVRYFPVIEILEGVIDQKLELVRVEIEDSEVMGDMEGFTHPSGEFIRFTEKVYRGAYLGRPRARGTVAHETGHFFLHTGKPLARVAGAQASIKPFECPERQAHQFAAELLTPRHLLRIDMTCAEIARDFGVSEEAAEKRLRFIHSLVSK
jgi:Zn-dependent peptidase ImmA (M78 family)